MGSRRVLAIAGGLLAAGLAVTGEVGATASDFYGNNFDENVLVPFAECSPGGIDTLIAITDPNSSAGTAAGLHVVVYNDLSVPVCDFDVTFTAGDVYPTNFCGIINDGATTCSSPSARAGLQLPAPAPANSFRGYLTFELCNRTGQNCTSDKNVGDALYGNIYYTDLDENRATALPAATFDPTAGVPFDSVDLREFPLFDVHELSFRFLTSLELNPALADTRAILWSATSGACQNAAGPVPDSRCLGGAGRTSVGPGEFLICDEEENCDSIGSPPLDREINVFSVDDLVGTGFPTDGGYFNLQPIGIGNAAGAITQDDTLHVIGITDQRANAVSGQPAARAAFYAPRD